LFEGKLNNDGDDYKIIQISTKAPAKEYFKKLRESDFFIFFINNPLYPSSPHLIKYHFLLFFTSFKKKNSSLFSISERKSMGLLLSFN